MEIKDKIALFRKQAKLSIDELAEKSGIPISTVKKISAGITKDPQIETLRALAYALGRTLDDFDDPRPDALSVPNLEPLPATVARPLLGDIACGEPITADENVEEYIRTPADLKCDFVLRCKGNSMQPRLLDGDLVYIRQQPDVEDGQIAAVVIDGEATLKHLYHLQGGGAQLVADNPAFPPHIYTGANCTDIRVVGRAVAYQRLL